MLSMIPYVVVVVLYISYMLSCLFSHWKFIVIVVCWVGLWCKFMCFWLRLLQDFWEFQSKQIVLSASKQRNERKKVKHFIILYLSIQKIPWKFICGNQCWRFPVAISFPDDDKLHVEAVETYNFWCCLLYHKKCQHSFLGGGAFNCAYKGHFNAPLVIWNDVGSVYFCISYDWPLNM